MRDSYVPKFSFEITEEQQTRANRLLSTHGIRKAVFSILLDEVLDMIDEHGQMVIGIILDKAVRPREVIKTLATAERKGSK